LAGAGAESGAWARQLTDSTHALADLNTGKDERRQKKGGQGPWDGELHLGEKHTRCRRKECGEKVRQPECFYGHEKHTSMGAQAGMLASGVVTTGWT